MTLREFVNTMVFGILMPKYNSPTFDDMDETYESKSFLLPRVYCKDGFNISVQCNKGSYCASENGVREFGIDWKLVEWDFPSEEIDGSKYNAEDESNTKETVGGYVEIELLEELISEHGGIDLSMTLSKGAGLK